MATEDHGALLLANVGQKVVCEKDGKVLMCRGRVTFKDMNKRWDFPGGRIHTGEEPIAALTRELKEELGVDFEIGRPLHVSLTYETPSDIPRYYVVFEARLVNPDAEFTIADDELSEVRWVGKDDIADLHTWEDWRSLLASYFDGHSS